MDILKQAHRELNWRSCVLIGAGPKNCDINACSGMKSPAWSLHDKFYIPLARELSESCIGTV